MASEKVTSILEEIKGLSVIELFDLEKAILRRLLKRNSAYPQQQ